MSILQTSGYPFALVICVLLFVALVLLLRTQRLREKYSVLWFAVVAGVLVLGFVPSLTTWLSSLVGVTTPINLVFILAFLVLLTVCIQLSIEISTLEESSRTVAEELALLRLEMEQRLGEVTDRVAEAPDAGGAAEAGQSREAESSGGCRPEG